MKYHYFRTMRGFIVLPADWQSHKFFTDSELARLEEINILEDSIPVIVDEYNLSCVAIRKNQTAFISTDSECIVFLTDEGNKVGYIADYGVYDEIEDALIDMSRNELSRVVEAITSARGYFSQVANNVADLGYQFSLNESVRAGEGTTIWYAGNVKLVMSHNAFNVITGISLEFSIGTYEKFLTPSDYGVDEDYAKEHMGILERRPATEDEE